jgi:hypothetical protein
MNHDLENEIVHTLHRRSRDIAEAAMAEIASAARLRGRALKRRRRVTITVGAAGTLVAAFALVVAIAGTGDRT